MIYTLFQLPQALATNIQTMLVARFIAGIGGSTAVAVLGGTLADLFSNEERGIPMAIFATVAFVSTAIAPALFGYLVQFRGFRPVMWIQFALSAATVILLFFLAKETRADVLLARKAKKMRLETGDKRFVAQAEEERASIWLILKVALTRPFHLLFTEPIIQAFTTLLSFVYAVLYLLLVAIPIVYARIYQFNTGQVGLVYLSQAAGTVLGAGITVWTNHLYNKNVAKRGAEARLYSGMVGGACLPVGSWIFAWSAQKSVHWIVPTIGIAIIYTGIFLIYTTCFSKYCMESGSLHFQSSPNAFLLRFLGRLIYPLRFKCTFHPQCLAKPSRCRLSYVHWSALRQLRCSRRGKFSRRLVNPSLRHPLYRFPIWRSSARKLAFCQGNGSKRP